MNIPVDNGGPRSVGSWDSNQRSRTRKHLQIRSRRFTMKRVGVSLILLTLILPLGHASTAWAGDKEDVAAAAAKWAAAFSAETPDRILALYDREAVLWGTLSPKRRDNPEAIRDYMVSAFKALPDRYSFVYAKRNGQWMIVDHHSSAMPAPPK